MYSLFFRGCRGQIRKEHTTILSRKALKICRAGCRRPAGYIGDVKFVQGDSGHAQAKMVTDQYSHILDEDRRNNAQLFEDAFYSGKESAADKKKGDAAEDKTAAEVPEGIDPATLAKILTNPEMASLLKALANSIS